MKKRILSIVLSVMLLAGMLPAAAVATVEPDTNLCQHHTAHDAACGYVQGSQGSPCTHTSHTLDCYAGAACGHEHSDACGGLADAAACTHTSHTLDCYAGAVCGHLHSDTCGYTEAVAAVPCGYACPDCAGEVTKYVVYVTDAPLDGSGGTVTGEGQYAPGDQVTISLVPNTADGYCAAQWSLADLGGGVISAIDLKTSHTFTMPEGNVQISVTFVQHSYIAYSDLEDGTHQNKCFFCQIPNGVPEAHVDVHGGGDGTTPPDEYCDRCSANLHTHSYSSGWTGDEEGHYHKCECGETTEVEAHEPGDPTTDISPQTCRVCGYEIAPHTHSYGGWWYSVDGHWRECGCGHKKDFASHKSGGAATEDKAEVCTVCDYEISPKLPTYTLTLVMGSETIGGDIGGLETKQHTFAPGTAVDLSEYWPSAMEYTVNGQTYYFSEFWEHQTGGNIVRSVTVSADRTVYAGWIRTKQITIAFEPNGGSLQYEQIRENAEIEIITVNYERVPARGGYDFVGWSLENDGTADDGDIQLTEDCTLYAVWQQDIPSYDDDYEALPVNVGGGYDVILRGDVAIVQGDDPISGTLDLTGTDAGAIRLPWDAVRASAGEGSTATICFPSGTGATLTASGWAAAGDTLNPGEDLLVRVRPVGAEALPEGLTTSPEGDEPFVDDEVMFDSGAFSGAGVFTEQELLELNVIDENNDDITWEELKYLYHYMTTAELKSLGWFVEDFLYALDPQVQVWLSEMIERDAVTPLNLQELMNMADLTDEQWEILADMDLNDPTIGQLRQAGLTLEQMKLLQSNAEELREGASAEEQAQYDALLSWLEEAISEKEQENKTAPTYINVGGEQAVFVSAVEVDIRAARADGTTTPVAIRADRSDAVAWSATIHWPSLSPLIGNVSAEEAIPGLRAYKVLEDGGLEEKACQVTLNTGGTLTLSAFSDGNSLYVFLWEPPAEQETAPAEESGGVSVTVIAAMIAAVVVLGGAILIFLRKKGRKN